MAEKAEAPKILDADALIDEIIAKKGPYKYTEGLSEDNWEEVSFGKTYALAIHCCTSAHEV